jgi:hypothetical protein
MQLPNSEREADMEDEQPVPGHVAPSSEDMIPAVVTPISCPSPPEKPFG